MSPVHSGGHSWGRLLPAQEVALEAWQSRVFPDRPIPPSLYSVVDGRSSTKKKGFHLDWPEGNRGEEAALWPGACCLDIVWAKDFYFVFVLGNFLPLPQIGSLGLVCFTHLQDTQILGVDSRYVPTAQGVPEANVKGGGH